MQFKEALAETVGEAKVPFQPEFRELLMEDGGQDMTLFANEADGYDMVLFDADADGHDMVFPGEVDGQDIGLDE